MNLDEALGVTGVSARDRDDIVTELVALGIDVDNGEFQHASFSIDDLRTRGWVSTPESYLQVSKGGRDDAGYRKVQAMIAVLNGGGLLPPILIVAPVYDRGGRVVVDGLHRLNAAAAAGFSTVDTILASAPLTLDVPER